MTGRSHVEELPLSFGDVDYARILYYPRLFHYCHVAMEGFFAAVTGRSYAWLLEERRIGFPTVRLEAVYHRPMPYGTTLRMELSVVKLGTSSAVLRYTETGDPAGSRAEVIGTVVCVDMDRFASQPIPDDLRAGMSAYLEPAGDAG